MNILSNSYLKLALLASLINEVSAYVYYSYRPGFCTYNACYSRYYGYYCCNYYWYSTGWAIAIYVFFGILLIGCFAWCCIAAATPSRTIYSEPATEIITVKGTSTQPKTITGKTGDSKVVNGGTYTVTGQNLDEGPPVQGQKMEDIEMDHEAPVVGSVYPEVKPPVDTV